MSQHQDLKGRRFERLVVVEFVRVARTGSQRGALWKCRCDCGAEKVLSTARLKKTKSCGCAVREYRASDKPGYQKKHGQAATGVHRPSLLYETWTRARTSDLGTDEAWQDFETFAANVGERPSRTHVLMRKDPTQPFGSSNCFWATREQVAANLKSAVVLTHAGVTKTVLEWARQTGLSKGIIKKRLARGWSVSETLERSPGRIEQLRIEGERYGRLTVLKYAGKNIHSQSMWLCLCDCGTEKVVGVSQLRNGATRSCGCLKAGKKTEPTSRVPVLDKKALARRLCRRASHRAQQYGLAFDLVPEELEIPDLCPVLGVPMIPQDRDTTPTIDRFDPAGGYTKENVAVISWRANSLKKNGTLEEFENLVRWMRSKHGNAE